MKKYDCNKTLDFWHEVSRLCKETGCDNCFMRVPFNSRCRITMVDSIDQKHIDLLQHWSDSHPEQTRMDKFLNLIKGTEFEDAFLWNPDSETLKCNNGWNWWGEASK